MVNKVGEPKWVHLNCLRMTARLKTRAKEILTSTETILGPMIKGVLITLLAINMGMQQILNTKYSLKIPVRIFKG